MPESMPVAKESETSRLFKTVGPHMKGARPAETQDC